MRSKFIPGALMAIITVGTLLVVSHVNRSRTTPQPADRATNAMSESQSGHRGDDAHFAPAPQTQSSVTNVTSGADVDHDKEVEKRIAELSDLSTKDDAASRDVILSELQNSNKAIRAGALEAIVQFGDRSVVPRLEQLAAETGDADEKAALLESAEYLKLPSLSEFLASQKTNVHSTATNPSVRDPNKRR